MTTNPSKPNQGGMDEELLAMLKYLRLRRLLSHWDQTLDQARKGRYSAERLLRYLVEEEYGAKRENARLLRRQRANIPELLEMETFPFARQPKLERKVFKRYLSYDCLVIDEVGYVEVEPAQVGQFFTLMHKRHKQKTTILTSNLGFAEWGSFLNNPHLTAALIDRLTSNSHVINMKNCKSLRDPLDK